MKKTLSTIAVAAAMTFAVGGAHAMGINSTLSATYYEVADFSDPDFNVNTVPVVADGGALGPDGLPVATGGVHDIGPSSQLTWWSPAFNANVVQTGTGVITLPFNSNMYAPGGTGTNDGSFFQTAKFAGVFALDGSGTVTFTLGSDDDSFLYVDNILIGQNPGVHGVSTVVFTSPTLAAGSHAINLFYADRQQTGAYLSLDSSASITAPSAPEPAAWALMIVGFGGVGAMARRRGRLATA